MGNKTSRFHPSRLKKKHYKIRPQLSENKNLRSWHNYPNPTCFHFRTDQTSHVPRNRILALIRSTGRLELLFGLSTFCHAARPAGGTLRQVILQNTTTLINSGSLPAPTRAVVRATCPLATPVCVTVWSVLTLLLPSPAAWLKRLRSHEALGKRGNLSSDCWEGPGPFT